MRASQLLVLVVGGLMVAAQPVAAEAPPGIDWKQFEESLDDSGDHVVGEEYCLRQAAPRLGFEVGRAASQHVG